VSDALLDVAHVTAGYGSRAVLRDISVALPPGQILLVLGHNGAGKTTLLRAIFGLIRPASGSIHYEGEEISGRAPMLNVRAGIALVPQGYAVFPRLSVLRNLHLGAFTVADAALVRQRLDAAYELFPILAERREQAAGTLSGGQRQMLAIAMALMISPRLLLLDEPSIGLAPTLVGTVMETIQRINRTLGTTVLLVEQNVSRSLPIAARAVVIRGGAKVFDGTPSELADHTRLMQLF